MELNSLAFGHLGYHYDSRSTVMMDSATTAIGEVSRSPSYNRARYYNPTTGRFLSEDPIGFRAGTNFYRYVLNDPIDFNDPSGRLPIGAVVGAVNGAVFGGLGAMTGGDWDWQDVALGAGLGAGTGFALGLIDPTEGALSSGPVSAAADLAGQWAHKKRHGQNTSTNCYNWGEVAGAGIGGGLGGGFGAYAESLAVSAGLAGGSSAAAEGIFGGAAGMAGQAVGGSMSGHKCGCQ